MKVTFQRTASRRYAVRIEPPGRAPQSMDPAPGYDDDIPHDLVHYVVEAELAFARGVFGRAAAGGGTFIPSQEGDARERARQQRKQQRRERSLHDVDEAARHEMATSERLAALADVAWRRRHGQRPDPLRTPPPALSPVDAAQVDKVVARLDILAPIWRAVPIGGSITFVWPNADPVAG